MDSIPVVAFRFHAKYGHFRKPYSNVSSFSYPFPPRTAIAGLLGAILGVKKEDVSDIISDDNAKIGLEIDGQVTTITHVTNFRQDSSGNVNYSVKAPSKNWVPKPLKNIPESNKPTQIPMELLREPSYLLYISLNVYMDELVARLKDGRYFYTPCMGLSEFLAELEYISEGMAIPVEPREMEVSTILSKNDCSLSLDHLRPELGYNIQELKLPHLGTPARTFTYKTYLVNLTSKSIPVKMKVSPYQYGDKIITFL